jgi:hypothetical protein
MNLGFLPVLITFNIDTIKSYDIIFLIPIITNLSKEDEKIIENINISFLFAHLILSYIPEWKKE